MDIEFHYYITFILCQAAGFDPDESYIIAYASQYTDDNNKQYYINYDGGGGFTSKISQTMDITKPIKKRRSIYPYFHFIPAGKEAEKYCNFKKDLKKKCKFNCGVDSCLLTVPNSRNSQEILDNALNSKDLFQIGIAIHSYADTWSHQNFMGCENTVNSWPVNPIDLGHAFYSHNPDIVDKIWNDNRLEEKEGVKNTERFLEAAENIFLKLHKFKNEFITENEAIKKYEKTELRKKLREAMTRKSVLKNIVKLPIIKLIKPLRAVHKMTCPRMKVYKKLSPDLKEKKFQYNKKEWQKKAFKPVAGFKGFRELNQFDRYWARDRVHFKDTNWYKFQKALENQTLYLKDKFKDIYKNTELTHVVYE